MFCLIWLSDGASKLLLITEDLQEIVFYGAAESLDALDMCAETMDNGEVLSIYA